LLTSRRILAVMVSRPQLSRIDNRQEKNFTSAAEPSSPAAIRQFFGSDVDWLGARSTIWRRMIVTD